MLLWRHRQVLDNLQHKGDMDSKRLAHRAWAPMCKRLRSTCLTGFSGKWFAEMGNTFVLVPLSLQVIGLLGGIQKTQ